jgi:lysophospholipase L1-like esterase
MAPLPGDAVILAFGDSLTFGTGASRDTNYPAILAALSRRTVVNAGVPGEVSAAGLNRLPNLIEQHRPALIIVCHGGNDMLRKLNIGAAEDNLRRMIELAQAKSIQVLLIGVPKPGLLLNTAAFYQRLADDYQLPYLPDVMAKTLADPALKADPVHPNGQGYRRIAETIHAELLRRGAL